MSEKMPPPKPLLIRPPAQGMAFVKKEMWTKAADKYRAAALLGGPHPVVLSNLAWAFIKLKQ